MRSDVCRTKAPKMPIRIEYEDENYTYMSSLYDYQSLKKDIEEIKVPITITWNQPAGE